MLRGLIRILELIGYIKGNVGSSKKKKIGPFHGTLIYSMANEIYDSVNSVSTYWQQKMKKKVREC